MLWGSPYGMTLAGFDLLNAIQNTPIAHQP
ncbi:hypothetical protein FRACA_680019 [Frankia canadensis]|uniref:Uncharacterized protein n=1 Tax=Frankia canadensis TaxID=1836972 RepID=A0A2I2L0A0_9ACTN|nr:hypothetical protein FRACA_680019 [Frankia canadensis]SOU58635.1 hypothetical protein FRACA_680019 [Frankia canadensis]